MPATKLLRLLGLPEVNILETQSGPKGIWMIAEKKRAKFEPCHRCGEVSSSIYDHRVALIRDEPIRKQQVTLKLRKRRYYCRGCRKPFTEYIPGIWPKRRTTQRLRERVRKACGTYSSMSDVRMPMRLGPHQLGYKLV